MDDSGFDQLGADHVSWLHVAADNFLRQRRPDRATALLELACLLAPDDRQSRKMLAYGYWLQGDHDRCADAVAEALARPLSAHERGAIEILQRRLESAHPGGERT